MASGVASNFVNNAPLVTYEGVNIIMYQQSSRLLLKSVNQLNSGKKLEGYLSYLNETESLLNSKSNAQTIDQFLEIQHLE